MNKKRQEYYQNSSYKILFSPTFADSSEKFYEAQTIGLLNCVVCLNDKDYYELCLVTEKHLHTDLCLGIPNLIVIENFDEQTIRGTVWCCAFAGHKIFFDSVKKSLPSKFKNYRPSVVFNLRGMLSELFTDN